MNHFLLDLFFIALVAVVSFSPKSLFAVAKSSDLSSEWKLSSFLDDVQKNPEKLIKEAEDLFSSNKVESSKKNPANAYMWQDRVAMISALSHFFDVNHKQIKASQIERASELIEHATLKDPSLLVRDAAVEAMRRVNRMRPGYSSRWKQTLEKAFMDHANQSSGEGLFIRETILAAMREASIKPSKKVIESAQGDLNLRVKSRLDEWNTSAY